MSLIIFFMFALQEWRKPTRPTHTRERRKESLAIFSETRRRLSTIRVLRERRPHGIGGSRGRLRRKHGNEFDASGDGSGVRGIVGRPATVLKAHDALRSVRIRRAIRAWRAWCTTPRAVTARTWSGLFAAADSNTDGAVTRAEFKTALEKWFQEADKEKSGAVTEADLVAALKLPQPRLPLDAHMQAMLAALPDRPAAKPTRQHKVLVLNKCAGFIHTPIPLVAKMIESFGNRTKAWSTTITFDPADINEQNLKQYDALVLNSTTGAFLDDPNDQAATDARRKALLGFVRGGKGLVVSTARATRITRTARRRRRAHVERVPAVEAAQRGAAPTLTTQSLLQGDKNNDQKLSKEEMSALADAWFDKLDPDKAPGVRQAEFVQRVKTAVIVPCRPLSGVRAPGTRRRLPAAVKAVAAPSRARTHRSARGPSTTR